MAQLGELSVGGRANLGRMTNVERLHKRIVILVEPR